MRSLPIPSELARLGVRLWHVDATQAGLGLPDAAPMALSPSERAHWLRLRRAPMARIYLHLHWLLRRCLGTMGWHCWGQALTRGPWGQPALPMAGAPHISLSYSEGEGVLALSRHHPVGVDLECLRPGLPPLKGCWSPAERAALALHGPQESCRLWTRKEAALKALGTGLSLPPETVCVQGPTLRWSLPGHASPAPDVALWSLALLPGRCLAVALHRPSPPENRPAAATPFASGTPLLPITPAQPFGPPGTPDLKEPT
jgi:4'-phosphopantetheinyl transferase